MRSLRGRLTAGLLLVLAAVLLVGGALALREVDASERFGFDDRLRRTAELSRATALAAVQQEVPEDDRRLDAVLSASGSSLRLRLGEAVLLEAGAPPPRRPPLRPGLQTFEVGGVSYRAYVTTLRDPSLGGLAVLDVVSSLEALEGRQGRLRLRLVGLAALALLVAAAGVWLTAGVVLRPLRRLRTITSSIAEDEHLDRRVPSDDGPAELRSLAADFNAMLARLEGSAADRERALAATRRFAADAGHELRTPLTSVQATLSTLARHPQLGEQRRSAMLADARAEQRRLVDLLDGLQALARGEAGPLPRQAVDLNELVDAVATATADRHPETRITAHLPSESVLVEGWEPGIRLLVENLVANAVRHGRAEGRVVVSVTAGPAEGDGAAAVLHVDDDGPGVRPADRERIFAPFARAAGTDSPGSGLGLTLAAQQARHHNAALLVSDSPLGGARFTVRFA